MAKVLVENKTTDDANDPSVEPRNPLIGKKQVFYPKISSGGSATFTAFYEWEGEMWPTESITVDDSNRPFYFDDIPNTKNVKIKTTGITGTVISLKTDEYTS